jgi:nicotinic acid mononucleotide adenylyltransferase
MNGVPPRHVFFTFGRFQPPTIGHAVLINTIIDTAANAGGDAYIFVSGTHDTKKNPLSIEEKLIFLEKMYAGKPVHFVDTSMCCKNNLIAIAHYLFDILHYTHATMIVGSDRLESFETTFKRFPEFYTRMSFLSAGSSRTLNQTKGVASVSGTLVRSYALHNNFNSFKQSVQMGSITDENVHVLMNKVREGLGVSSTKNGLGKRRISSRKSRKCGVRTRQSTRRKQV